MSCPSSITSGFHSTERPQHIATSFPGPLECSPAHRQALLYLRLSLGAAHAAAPALQALRSANLGAGNRTALPATNLLYFHTGQTWANCPTGPRAAHTITIAINWPHLLPPSQIWLKAQNILLEQLRGFKTTPAPTRLCPSRRQ